MNARREGKEMELIHFSLVSDTMYFNYIHEWECSGEKISPGASERNCDTFEGLQKKMEI